MLSLIVLAHGTPLLEPTWIEPSPPGAYPYNDPATLCDVTGDGLDDIVLSHEDPIAGPQVLVHFGHPTATMRTPDQVLDLPQDQWGHRPTCLGDHDGDGFDDVAVAIGAQVEVLRGTATGLVAPGWRVDGDRAHRLGDVDGDGRDDLLVVGALSEGIVRVHLGGPMGPSAQPAWTSPPADDEGFVSVTGADIHGDGYADVLVALDDPSEVKVYGGDPGGVGVGTVALQSAAGVFFREVSTMGDIDQDGDDDIYVELVDRSPYINGYGYYGFELLADAYDGTPAGLDPTPWTPSNVYPPSPQGDSDGDGVNEFRVGAFLYRMAGARPEAHATWRISTSGAVPPSGDVNGDGLADLVQAGDDRLALFLGGTPPLSVRPTIEPTQDFDTHGVHYAGDLDGDGFGDLIVGSGDRLSASGDVVWFRGTPTGPEFVGPVDPPFSTQQDRTLARLGDVNGDGFDDVAVGVPESPANGSQMVLLLGGSDGPTISASYVMASQNVRLGSRLAAGDFDGDGLLDVAVSEDTYRPPSARPHIVRVFHHTEGFFRGEPLSLSGAADRDRFGRGIAAADWDGDGYDDLLIGVPGTVGPTSTEEAGRLELYRGGPGGLATTPAWSLDGTGAEQLGNDVALLDIDGDGVVEVLATADIPTGMELQIYDGALGIPPTTPSASHVFASTGLVEEPRLVGVGDIDGDGTEDLVVHRAFAGPTMTLHLGTPAGFDPTPAWTAPLALANHHEGMGVDAGDIDADGVPDLIIAHPYGALIIDGDELDEPPWDDPKTGPTTDTGTPMDTGTPAPTEPTGTDDSIAAPRAPTEAEGCSCRTPPEAAWTLPWARRR